MLRTITAPENDPVSLAEAKAQLGLATADSSKDELLTALIKAATAEAESIVQRRFIMQTVEWPLEGWRGGCIHLPVAPVAAADGIVSIEYTPFGSDVAVELDASMYVVRTSGPTVRILPRVGVIWSLLSPDASEPVVITFKVGAAQAPPNVKQAILLIVKNLFLLAQRDPTLVSDSVIGVGQKQYAASADAAAVLPDAARAMLLSEAWS